MASGNFAVASSNKYVSCTCWWSSTPDTNGNYSTVNFELRASRTNSGYTTYGTGSGSVTINGTAVSFSITSSQKITQNSNTLLGSGSVVVYHNDDGSKNVTISAYASIPGASLTLGTTSATVALDTIARASVPTLNASTFTITKANSNFMRIYTNWKSSSFTHHIYYSFNGSSEVCLGSGITDYYDWYFPNTLANNIPNAASGTGYIRLYTFNGGTNIGSRTVSFTMQVDEKFIPSAVLEIADAAGYFEQYGKYIQGNSKVTGIIIAEGCYGSTIKSYKTTFDGKTFTDAEFTTDVIIGKDELNLEVIVTDSRGRTCTLKESISVYEYKPPKIISINAKRCQEYNVNELGDDYLGVVFNSEVTSLDSQNLVKYELDYKKTTEDSYTTISLSDYTNMHEVEGYAIFAADDDAYNIILRITDAFGTTEKKINGPSISVLISKLKYNLGLAFGKLAELSGVLDIGFKTRFHGGLLRMVLEEGTNLDELKTPNTYAGRDIESAGYLNCPSGVTGKFMLLVESAGDNGEIYHRLTTCNQTNPLTYERFCIDDEWGDWICRLSTTEWKDCTFTAVRNILYNDGNAYAKYRYSNSFVEVVINGTYYLNSEAIESGEAMMQISGLDVTIPETASGGIAWDDSSKVLIPLSLNTDGTITLSGANTSIAVKHWIGLHKARFIAFY